ncbi:hypothetical protein CEXT_64031 [Caerostris extrusa]|uniref:Uncharacterized protein n=1 Tax=Caerostris extrusa TaxID=172846 RepID=A0AAV4QCA0_CAEEX|nr:hypothetical protein CEXT_64031 [Caerostris extrusa]
MMLLKLRYYVVKNIKHKTRRFQEEGKKEQILTHMQELQQSHEKFFLFKFTFDLATILLQVTGGISDKKLSNMRLAVAYFAVACLVQQATSGENPLASEPLSPHVESSSFCMTTRLMLPEEPRVGHGPCSSQRLPSPP